MSGSILRGELVYLRHRTDEDRLIIDACYADLATDISWSEGDVPVPDMTAHWTRSNAESVKNKDVGQRNVMFAVCRNSDDKLIGGAALHSIDLHHRIILLKEARGQGYGTDVIRLCTAYGFATRGFHRIGMLTQGDNKPMQVVAEKVGFTKEGVMRRDWWHAGAHRDTWVYGMLSSEWPGYEQSVKGVKVAQ